VKIVQGDEINVIKGVERHRVNASDRVHLLEGEDGTPGNFSLVIARPDNRYSPRHRHNFEQFRYQIEGTADYSRTGKLKAGMIGYFPEGVHYGPQQKGEPGEKLAVLVLQCGGASGAGYISRAAVPAATEELKKLGTFEGGVFRRNPGLPGKKNVDGFQAVWEHINQRPLVYPKARYDVPILMHPDAFEWVPVEGARGVYEKVLGFFTERRTSATFLKLDGGAAYTLSGKRDIYFVLSGTGTLGGEPYRRLTTLFLERGDTARIAADEATEILHLGLPDLAGLPARQASRPAPAEAAE
jgi:mannose-6-phosphate isomerase-like protein (cupin superfamily)